MKYFANSYEEAREKFLDATKDAKITSFEIQPGLFMDCALFEKKGAKSIIILQSGVHGVEGYIGGAFQLAVLDKILPKINASVLLIHAVNPYGMKYNRRVNENNVDLNRNCIDDFNAIENQDKRSNLIIRKSQKFVAPKRAFRIPWIEWVRAYSAVISMVFNYGLSSVIRAAVAGQSRHPKSVAFRGTELQVSTIKQIDYIKKVTKGYQRAAFFDLHTGTGKKFDYTTYTPHQEYSEEFFWFKRIFDKVSDTGVTKNRGVDFLGSFDQFFLNHAKSHKRYAIIVEFGTVGRFLTVQSIAYLARMIVVENQVTFYGPKKILKSIRKHFLRLYYPNSSAYRKFVIKKANNFSTRLIRAVNSW